MALALSLRPAKHLRAVVAPVAYVAIAGVFCLQKSIAALRLMAVSRYVSSRSEVSGGSLAIVDAFNVVLDGLELLR